MEKLEQILVIFTAVRGFLTDVPVEKVTVFQRDYLKFINSSHTELIEQINKQQKLDDNLEENIKKSIEEFKASYTV